MNSWTSAAGTALGRVRRGDLAGGSTSFGGLGAGLERGKTSTISSFLSLLQAHGRGRELSASCFCVCCLLTCFPAGLSEPTHPNKLSSIRCLGSGVLKQQQKADREEMLTCFSHIPLICLWAFKSTARRGKYWAYCTPICLGCMPDTFSKGNNCPSYVTVTSFTLCLGWPGSQRSRCSHWQNSNFSDLVQ